MLSSVRAASRSSRRLSLLPTTTATLPAAHLPPRRFIIMTVPTTPRFTPSQQAQEAAAKPFQLPNVVPTHLATHDNEAKIQAVSRDLRSDTLTVPTDSQMKAAFLASRGDDVYLEDESTTSFEAEIAALAGKEAAVFVVSGTLSNQLALRTHLLQPPYSILLDQRGHINRYEAGGAAFHSGAALTCVEPSNGHHLRWTEDVEPNLVLGDDIHYAPTRIISLENSLNGLIFPQNEIVKIAAGARQHDIKMHLDGARIWNVSAETGLSIEELCRPFDTVSMCFSKGLGAPVGTVLVGPTKFITKVKHFRKLFGAGIRQSGCLAAAARTGLVEHFPKLKATHELAQFAARELTALGAEITSPAETSMFFFNTAPLGFSNAVLADRAGQLTSPIKMYGPRIVVHHQTDPKTIEDLLALVAELKVEFAEQAKAYEHGKASKGDQGGMYATHKALR